VKKGNLFTGCSLIIDTCLGFNQRGFNSKISGDEFLILRALFNKYTITKEKGVV